MIAVGAANTQTFSPTPLVTPVSAEFPTIPKGSPITVIGAGAFGGWSALFLLRHGYKVTLIDAWGAGNSRSSSGDETRVTRSTYGHNELYFQMNVRALELWKEYERSVGQNLFFNKGVLWFCYKKDNPLVDDSIPFAKKFGMEYEYLSVADLRSRFPQVRCDDLSHAYFDSFGGYLRARDGMRSVLSTFIAEGGSFIQAEANPGNITNGRMADIRLSNGTSIRTENFLFACGSWLPQIFPKVLSEVIKCTRQEVYYFGVPAAEAVAFDNLPVWIDLDDQNFYYGIADNASRGFKIGVDKRGPAFDPTNGEHSHDADVLSAARKFIAHRFPALAKAPLVENRVCPYENSIDGNFIFDRHPEISNVFLLGGGSGHGFKHGPALGELVSKCLSGESKVPDLFRMK